MSVSSRITKYLNLIAKGQPFHRSELKGLGSRSAISSVLSRLVQKNVLERVYPGIYMRPRYSACIGKIRPSPISVVKILVESKGELIQVYGAVAVQKLGLSTQMQMQPVYYTSGKTREFKFESLVIRLQHVERSRLQLVGTKAGLALTALYYLGRAETNKEIAGKILAQLSSEDMNLLRACKLPAWMADALDLRNN